MKKHTMLATVLSGLLILSGCSSTKTTSTKQVDPELLSAAIQALPDCPKFMELGDTDINGLMGLQAEDYKASVALMPLMNVYATEVMLFTYDTEDQKTKIESALDTRVKQLEKTWSQYLPDQYELVQAKDTVDENGMVGYIIGEDAFKEGVHSAIEANTK